MTTQCYNCTEHYAMNELGDMYKVGYLYSNNECRNPKCPSNQYFAWNPTLTNGVHLGLCQPCHSRCKSCVGPKEDDCLTCYPGYKEEVRTCRKCEEYIGYFTNEEKECEEICGDGLNAG